MRRYGAWVRNEAQKRIGHLYPKVLITKEMVASRPDLQPYLDEELTVVAWLWARTVKSPNPAFSHVDVPLASSFILSSKTGKEAYVKPVVEGIAIISPSKQVYTLNQQNWGQLLVKELLLFVCYQVHLLTTNIFVVKVVLDGWGKN